MSRIIGTASPGRTRGVWSRRVTAIAVTLVLAAGGLFAQSQAEISGGVALPVTRIALFSSGVGYFEHQGTIVGEQVVELAVPAGEINDLLKSLVVQDLDGGSVTTVRYGSQDPLARMLQGFALDLSQSPGLVAILQQARGESVGILGTQSITGTVLGVESRQIAVPDAGVVSVQYLNLWSDGMVRSVAVNDIRGLSFENPRVQQDIDRALAMIADSRNTEFRGVRIHFVGRGSRRVRFGYLRQTPVWKTAYRVIAGAADAATADLQGWAIVENTSAMDWNNVELSLIAGRPMSFVMNLYDPIYVQRPTVQFDTGPQPAPVSYESDMMTESVRRVADAPRAMAQPAPVPTSAGVTSRGVTTVATTADLGAFFEYRISEPISIRRYQSAMVPIVTAPIAVRRTSLYNYAVLANNPLIGLELTNDTGAHLMAGPVTVFDNGVYAGDAQFTDITTGDSRYISYAVDLETTVVRSGGAQSEQITTVRVVNGQMTVARRQVRTTEYAIANRATAARQVVVEQPTNEGWTVLSPPLSGRTAGANRFTVTVPARSAQPTVLAVQEERIRSETISIGAAGDGQLGVYIDAREVPQPVRDALREVGRLRAELGATVSARRLAESRLQAIYREQERIRANMTALDRASELYQRYVTTLSDQEAEINGFQQQIQALQDQETERRGALEAFIADLNL